MGKLFLAYRRMGRASSWLELASKSKSAKPESCSSQNVLGRELSGCYSADSVILVNSLQKHITNGEPQTSSV